MTPQSEFDNQRERMIGDQIKGRGIHDVRVLAALRAVPRHRFVPERLQNLAYEDGPLPIGNNQTISQPYIVALMTQMLELRPGDSVLEIGTGSGYQTAVLCEIAKQVYTLERHSALANRANALLDDLGYTNVEVYTGDGSQGLPDMAPFDAIIVTAAAPAIPGPLRAQMANGGRMVLPTGERHQQLLQRVRRSGDAWQVESTIPVMFVPLYGQHGFTPSDAG
ncbi:MAG: protein-L-isoaspartate(D-aspartate) O-methyltransferase [Anaerolineae bacterium]|nr:protein-L-isoaspartate(D-aspartate) O-methyltransferase [Anaerolineae bacterium]